MRSEEGVVVGQVHPGRPDLAHRDISLRCKIRSLSGHSGCGQICCWLGPVANDPKETLTSERLVRESTPSSIPIASKNVRLWRTATESPPNTSGRVSTPR